MREKSTRLLVSVIVFSQSNSANLSDWWVSVQSLFAEPFHMNFHHAPAFPAKPSTAARNNRSKTADSARITAVQAKRSGVW